MKTGKIGAIFLAVVVICILVGGFICCERVPTGYVGVVYNISGGVTGDVYTQGFHIVPPTKNITLYSIGIEQSYLTSEDKGDSPKDESFTTPNADGKSLKVDLEFSYRFDSETVADTFTRFKGQSGKDIKDTFIKPKMIAWTQEVTAKYPVTDVFGDKRQELNNSLDTYLKAKFKPYGIVIDTVNFTNISTDEETQAAIQKKVNAQQELELARIEKETALVQAQKEKEVAQVNAESVKIQTEAEAARYKALSEQITPQLIQKWEMEARKAHGWVTVQGANTVIK